MKASRTSRTVEVALPDNLHVPLAEIAKLAGMPVEALIKLALAAEIWRWDRDKLGMTTNARSQR